MQHCEECGAELPKSALFCGHCGSKATREDEIATNENSTPVEDISKSPSGIVMTVNDSLDTTSDHEENQQQQAPTMLSENGVEAEEQTSYVTSEFENEERGVYHLRGRLQHLML